ncbi:MAG TPA: CoA transferase [Xanthobacteraceae bacterium]|jgi:crotonobetainyl-CoA:carnitine CoA-transferase CaiB-like acyl-CoA transferase
MPDTSPPPLQGLLVLDLTQVLSGPYGTQVLGDLGAEVIKIESPQGDLARTMQPHFVGPDSVYFASLNRNKRSVVVDLKTPEGIDLVRRLAASCDVVVENNRPGVLARLGLRADELRRQNPKLIWCAITGFGQDGPYRDKPAYDMIVQALSGGMSLTGETGGRPVRAGIPIGDIAAGMYAVIAILAALNRRNATGQGETIDISMLDCQAAMLTYQAAYFLHAGQVPARQGSGHDSIPIYRSFAAGDGKDFVVCALTETNWQALCRVIGKPALADDPRFATNRDRYQNRAALWATLEADFKAKPATEWVALCEAESIPVAIVSSIDQVVADPQIRHRHMVTELDAPDGRHVQVMGNPIALVDTPPTEQRFPPRLGENTTEVLRDVMGLSAAEIDDLVRKGVVKVG